MHKTPGNIQRNVALGAVEFAKVAKQLENLEPVKVLEWAVEEYGESLTLSVSFGNAEGMILLDMLSRITDRVRVFTLDTGLLFKETNRFREEVMQRYQWPLEVFRPEFTVAEQDGRFGAELHRRQPDLCCRMRKEEPHKRALRGYKAWVTGIRRGQTPQRANIPVVGWDKRFRVVKIAPLAPWSEEQVESYARRHEVPLNPLIKRGYRSVGCEPCTRPVARGEDTRAGRWPGREKTECGIHVAEGKVGRAEPYGAEA